jgi:two-component system, OmpR family, sensor kinase
MEPRRVRRPGRAAARFGIELIFVCVAAALFVVLAAKAASAVSDEVGTEVLTLIAAAVGAAAAITADVAARLSSLPRLAWTGAALALYSLAVLPSTTITVEGAQAVTGLTAARLVAYVGVIVLLLLAVRSETDARPWFGWAIAAGATVLALAVGELVYLVPVQLLPATLPNLLSVVALAGWGWCAAVYVFSGLRWEQAPLWRIGLGIGVLAVAQIYRVLSGGPNNLGSRLPFATLRLYGLVVVVVAAAGILRTALAASRTGQQRQQEELRIAAMHLHRAEEAATDRDHELRNGLAGLAGAVALLSSDASDPAHTRLRAAVLGELNRLQGLVGATSWIDTESYDAGRVLDDIVTLRRAAGMDVELRVDDRPVARGSPDTLRQVTTNLLDNCARHAPGARVTVGVGLDGPLVVVTVADDGPGLAPGTEDAVLERGVRHPRTGGSGRGLHISRELLATESGTLHIEPVRPDRPGLVVVVTLPADAAAAFDADPTHAEGGTAR